MRGEAVKSTVQSGTAGRSVLLDLLTHRMFRVWLYLAMALTVLVFIVPMYWMLTASVKTLGEIYTFPPQWVPTSFRWANYSEAWRSAPFGRFYVNTVIVTFFGVALEVVNACLTAYALAYIRFPGKNFVFIALLATLMIPLQVTILPNYLTIASLGWLNTYQGIVLPGASVAFTTFLLRQHFMTLPKEVMEAAIIEGAGHLRRLVSIVLPLSKPMLVTITLISVVAKWNDYLWPLIVTNKVEMRVLSIGIKYLFDTEGANQWGVIMAGTVFVVIPVLALFIWAQRYMISGLTAGALKG